MREINVETIEIQISLQIVMRRIRGKSILILYQYSSRNYKINIDIINIHYHFRKIENTQNFSIVLRKNKRKYNSHLMFPVYLYRFIEIKAKCN